MRSFKLAIICPLLLLFAVMPVTAQQTTRLRGDFAFSSLELQLATISEQTLSIVIVGDILTPFTDNVELNMPVTTDLNRPRQVSATGTMVFQGLPANPTIQIEQVHFELEQLDRDEKLLSGTIIFSGPMRLTRSDGSLGGVIGNANRISFPMTLSWAGGSVSLVDSGYMSIDLVLICLAEAMCGN